MREISTTLWVLITIFTHDQLPLHSLLTTCCCKHLQDPLLERSFHNSQNDCPWIHEKLPRITCIYSVPSCLVVVCHCLKITEDGCNSLSAVFVKIDFIEHFMTCMIKVVWEPILVLLVYNSGGSRISKREIPFQHRCKAKPYLIAGHSNFHNTPYN